MKLFINAAIVASCLGIAQASVTISGDEFTFSTTSSLLPNGRAEVATEDAFSLPTGMEVIGAYVQVTLEVAATALYGEFDGTEYLFTEVSSGKYFSNDSGLMTYLAGQSSSTNPLGFGFYRIPSPHTFDVGEPDNFTVQLAPVPEPSAALLGAFGVLGILRRRRIG